MRLLGFGRSAILGNRILSVRPPQWATLKRRSIHPRSPRCQAARAERFFQKAFAAQLKTYMKSMKSKKKALGFRKGLAAQGEALQATPIEFQCLLERPQRAQVNRQGRSPHLQGVLGANNTPIRDQKSSPNRWRTAAADAAPQLRTQAEGIQGPEFDQEPQPSIRTRSFNRLQGRKSKVEQGPCFRGGPTLRSHSVQNFHQVSRESKPGHFTSKGQEGRNQDCLFKKGHSAPAARATADTEMIEDIQGARETPKAATGSLGDDRHTTRLRGQEVSNPVRLAKVDRAQKDRFARELRHAPSLGSFAWIRYGGRGGRDFARRRLRIPDTHGHQTLAGLGLGQQPHGVDSKND